MNIIPGILLKHITSKYDREQFTLWAFGKEHQDLFPDVQLLRAWNMLHSDIFLLKMCNNPAQDIPHMIELYYQYLEKQQKKENPMLNEIKNLFEKSDALIHSSTLLNGIHQIVKFAEQHIKDPSLRDSALDAIIKILEQEKSQKE